jgi:hypothetical protein
LLSEPIAQFGCQLFDDFAGIRFVKMCMAAGGPKAGMPTSLFVTNSTLDQMLGERYIRFPCLCC